MPHTIRRGVAIAELTAAVAGAQEKSISTCIAGCDDALAETRVVAYHLDPQQHLLEVAGDGDLVYRIGQLTLLDPEPHRALRVVAGTIRG